MDQTDWVFTLAGAEERLPAPSSGMRYHEAFRRGATTLGFYAPRGADPQGPHLRALIRTLYPFPLHAIGLRVSMTPASACHEWLNAASKS
jgi:hypothetical protein